MALSAFIVRVPEAEPYVGALRARFDPSARLGVPAHVTVLYPFMAPDRVDAAVLARVLAITGSLMAFAFRLAAIRRFSETLYLAPEPAAPFIDLTLRLAREFPDHPPYQGRHEGIVPHLTVAQADTPHLGAAEVELRAALPLPQGVSARCRELVLIENESGLWRPMHVFALGPNSNRSERG